MQIVYFYSCEEQYVCLTLNLSYITQKKNPQVSRLEKNKERTLFKDV